MPVPLASADDFFTSLASIWTILLTVAATAPAAYLFGRRQRDRRQHVGRQRGRRSTYLPEPNHFLAGLLGRLRLGRRSTYSPGPTHLSPEGTISYEPLTDLPTHRFEHDHGHGFVPDIDEKRQAAPVVDLLKPEQAAPTADLPHLKEPAMPHLAWLIPLSSPNNPIPFTKPVMTLGRDRSRDIVVDDRTVSRNHATIEHHHDTGWWLTSYKTSNGTFVNDMPAPVGQSRPLGDGDRIRLGDAVFTFLTSPINDNGHTRQPPVQLPETPVPDESTELQPYFTFDSAAATSLGGRETNNDVYVIRPGWLAIADGMGKDVTGAVAAKLVEDELRSKSIVEQTLPAAVDQINNVLYRAPHIDRRTPLVGSTLDIVRIGPHSAVEGIHIGDGMVFVRQTRGHVIALTNPHTEGSRWDTTHASHRLTRGIGFDPTAKPDQWQRTAVDGDRYLLATDGLLDAFGREGRQKVGAVLQNSAHRSPRELVDDLMTTALAAKPRDNVTVIVADVIPRRHKEIRR